MDHAACNVVYVDRTAGEDRLVRRSDIPSQSDGASGSDCNHHNVSAASLRGSRFDQDVVTLLGTFNEVHICNSGKSCVRKLEQLHETSLVDMIPTVVLIDIPYDDSTWEEQRAARTPSPTASRTVEEGPVTPDEVQDRFYGLSLLQWISSDIQQGSLTKLVVPVAMVAIPAGVGHWESGIASLDQKRTMRYLDVGAVDALTTPLLKARVPSLTIHAYRAHKESIKDHSSLMELKRGRKRSWVGLDDQKPYAYLREAMVSGLMDGICRTGGEELSLTHPRLSIPADRKDKIVSSVSSWGFSAHDFTDDELLQAAVYMLQHALSMPELEQWRIPAENLTGFLTACRSAYNSFVPYHNFRHVIDVLQACFHFLVRIGVLPPYPVNSSTPIEESAKSPLVALLRPFDALTLLITAIGHDVGHPGVNNAFLVTLNAPLAQLYNDRSVLESFHCAAYSQILRRHWPSVFSGVEMRQLMISSILATDMGLHFDYMKKLGFLEEKIHENKGTDGWNGRLKEEYRTLACSLLIKCADISNVARKYDVAAKWTMILTDEFARQASMERDLAIPSALFAPPVREIVELGQSQVGFMNMFAIPLFQGVTDVMPAMQFCVDELQRNRKIWEEKIEVEQAKQRKDSEDSVTKDGAFSPRNLSLARKQGSTASDTSSHLPGSGNIAPGDAKGHTRSPLSSPDSAFSNFRSLEDLPSSDELVQAGHLSSESLLPTKFGLGQQDSIPSEGLEVPYSTTSAHGLFQKGLKEGNFAANNTSLVTDAVVAEPEINEEVAEAREDDKEELRDASGEAPRNRPRSEWTASGSGSQTTSATTGLPLSPSTNGTSLSDDDVARRPSATASKDGQQEPTLDETTTANDMELQPVAPGSSNAVPSTTTSIDRGRSPPTDNDKNNNLKTTMKGLSKRSSRSRFRFWKKKGSIGSDKSMDKTLSKDEDVPPLPSVT